MTHRKYGPPGHLVYLCKSSDIHSFTQIGRYHCPKTESYSTSIIGHKRFNFFIFKNGHICHVPTGYSKTKVSGPQPFILCLCKTKSATQNDQKKLTRSKGWKKRLTMKIWEEYTLYTPLSFSYSWSGGAGVLVETWRTESANLSADIIIMTSYLSSSSSSSSLRLSPSLCNTERLPRVSEVKPDHKTDWVNNSIGWHQLFKSVPLIDSNYIVSFPPQE